MVATMSYNADGLRVRKQDSAATSRFVWDQQNVLLETDADGTIQAAYTLQPRAYGNLISQRRGEDSHFHHFDALGSVRELTDSSQSVSDTYLHEAFGDLIAHTGTTVNPFRWVGSVGYYCDLNTVGPYAAITRLAYYI